jgi:hypothetical protein
MSEVADGYREQLGAPFERWDDRSEVERMMIYGQCRYCGSACSALFKWDGETASQGLVCPACGRSAA